MTTLHKLRSRYTNIQAERQKLNIEANAVLDLYYNKLSTLLLEANVIQMLNWKIGNCGLKTIRFVHEGELPIELREIVSFSRRFVEIVNGIYFEPYDQPVIVFETIEKAQWFINEYKLKVKNFDALVTIHKLRDKINELRCEIADDKNEQT